MLGVLSRSIFSLSKENKPQQLVINVLSMIILLCLGCLNISVSASQNTEKSIIIKQGDNLYKLFKKHHVPQKQLQALLKLGKPTELLQSLKVGSTLDLTLNTNNQLNKLVYTAASGDGLVVHYDSSGFHAIKIAPVYPQQYKTIAGTFHHSLYQDTVAAGLPPKLVQPLADLFSWKVSLAKALHDGDSFHIIYTDAEDGSTHGDELVAAEITHKGELLEAICYQTSPTAKRHCYTPEGSPLTPVFSRYPVNYSHISDHFNPKRKHPILHVIRPHWGVDFAAKKGTPIHATADGKITYLARKGGFGRFIEIDHNQGISTRYAHLSGYKKGLKKGAHVKRNEVIGYVGKSGLCTGSHLHYEYRVHGIAKNPLTVKLPQGASLNQEDMAAFQAFKVGIWQN